MIEKLSSICLASWRNIKFFQFKKFKAKETNDPHKQVKSEPEIKCEFSMSRRRSRSRPRCLRPLICRVDNALTIKQIFS